MISYIESDVQVDGKRYGTIAGLSTDSKPTANVANGSVFIEMNTGKVFMFDEAGVQWVEM